MICMHYSIYSRKLDFISSWFYLFLLQQTLILICISFHCYDEDMANAGAEHVPCLPPSWFYLFLLQQTLILICISFHCYDEDIANAGTEHVPCLPPSIGRMAPVMKEAWSEARKPMASATSHTCPTRPSGWAVAMAAMNWNYNTGIVNLLLFNRFMSDPLTEKEANDNILLGEAICISSYTDGDRQPHPHGLRLIHRNYFISWMIFFYYAVIWPALNGISIPRFPLEIPFWALLFVGIT